jgi:DNA-binding GntR family transcriptional regulator
VRGRIALRRIAGRDGRGLKPMVELHRTLNARIRAGDVDGAADRIRAIFQRIADALEAA